MQDHEKTKDQLIYELNDMRRKVAEFEMVQKSLTDEASIYRKIVNETNEAIFIIQEGWIKFVNWATLELTGYSKEEDIFSQAFETFVYPDDRDMVNHYHTRRLQGDKARFRYNYRYVCKDGAVKWAEMNSSLISWEKKPGDLCLVTDITEPRWTEESLQTSEERFRRMFERHSAVMLLIEPVGGKIVDANKAAERFYGYTISQLRSMYIREINILPPAEVESLRLLAVKRQCSYAIFSHRLANREIRTVEAHFSPIEENGQKLLFSIIHDVTDRKNAEEELRKSEERFSKAFQKSPILMAISNVDDGTIIDVNDKFSEVLGFSREESIGKTSVELGLLLPEDRTLMIEELQAHGCVRGMNLKLLTKDKREINCVYNGELIQTKTRRLLLSIAEDVTERKRVEEALRESEERHRSIVEHLPQRIFIKDRNSVYLSCNQNCASDLGITPEQITGKDDFAFYPPELAQAYRADDQDCMATGIVEDIEEIYQLHGQYRWAHTIKVPYRDEQGRVVGVVGIYEDITERKQHEEELLRIRAAVDGASDAISMATPEGEHFYQNRAFSDLFGYTVDDLNESDGIFRAFKDHDDARVVFDKIRRGESWSGELEMLSKDGRCFIVLLRANAIRDTQGSIICFIGIHTDVTKLRAVEQALTHRDAALLESERRFKTLFDSASDGIFIKDGELRYTDVNTIMLQFLDMRLSDIIGKTDKDLFGEYIAVKTQNVESRVIKGQTIETQESLLYKSEPISVDCIRFPLRDSSHKIIGVCGIVREMVYCPQTLSCEPFPGYDYLSPAMRSTILRARVAAETDSSIVLTGESGSGKDRLARYIHDRSSRSRSPFYVVNCAAIPSELAESELFGHEAGAFTGAVLRKRGLIELAEGGTLLLNEIGELSYPLQGKLLQFLDTFSFTRVGGEKKVTVNIRLITATNRDLGSEVSEGRFRKDLYYRLNVFPIHVPSLRERKEDIPLLVKEIVSELTANMALQKPAELDFEALRRLCLYSWPGNVRELRNVLERSLILSHGQTIGVRHLVGIGETEGTNSLLDRRMPLNRTLNDILVETERSLIQDALRCSCGKKSEAARILGISPLALARHMEKLGIR